ncbi:BhlA/UviB family holin-like peptide [Alkalihalobacterium chitinilyticum]|uniref:BhlA/UviB family holin-like peptide n=1 Tax=Alkalihalobacterium chitinilyticum TaxID=2980103 RepID=A0ABT5VJ41_9BACI|nr:BhlA/UviB family holin-like peptide [Alkalihalobacterium chitinilyticum]MDE5415474.1 BhlA/UviB family holin-like peptide [Alkalihalobacterium chitinilyticum]
MPVEELVAMALKEGLFAALFVFMFIYFLREAKNREEGMRDMYSQLSPQIDKVLLKIDALENKTKKVEEVSKDVAEIKFLLGLIETTVKKRVDR